MEELKKEYDHAKEKARAAINTPIIQTEVSVPPPSNGMTVVVPENIGSITPNKYTIYLTLTNIFMLIIFCLIENQLKREAERLQWQNLEVGVQET